ncbi:MAG: phosphopentomutase, partial [Clostridiales bacterium]|nr:phosphopentomutase [Clostridiales bacterium]
CAVGKVSDIFAGQGISKALTAVDNPGVLARLLEAMRETEGGLIFANFVDFDMLYGHRNDVAGYGQALEKFDAGLPRILELLREDDLLFLTADHGNDPTTPSTDHNREYVPLLACGPKLLAGVDLGVRASFADLGSTAAEYLEAGALPAGESFLPQLLPGGGQGRQAPLI